MINVIERLKTITPTEFAHLGMQQIAYVRRVIVDDQPAYEIHAADGQAMGVLRDRDTAFAAVRQHELEPVSVH